LTREDLIKLYLKERDYQIERFGKYSDLPELSFPSFILFLKTYIDQMVESYTKEWKSIDQFPEWLHWSKEIEYGSATAPVQAYENLVKIFALAGAALETYTLFNIEDWRKEEAGEVPQKGGPEEEEGPNHF